MSAEQWRGVSEDDMRSYLEKYLTHTRPSSGIVGHAIAAGKTSSKDKTISLQGDHLEQLKALAAKAGYGDIMKGAGL